MSFQINYSQNAPLVNISARRQIWGLNYSPGTSWCILEILKRYVENSRNLGVPLFSFRALGIHSYHKDCIIYFPLLAGPSLPSLCLFAQSSWSFGVSSHVSDHLLVSHITLVPPSRLPTDSIVNGHLKTFLISHPASTSTPGNFHSKAIWQNFPPRFTMCSLHLIKFESLRRSYIYFSVHRNLCNSYIVVLLYSSHYWVRSRHDVELYAFDRDSLQRSHTVKMAPD